MLGRTIDRTTEDRSKHKAETIFEDSDVCKKKTDATDVTDIKSVQSNWKQKLRQGPKQAHTQKLPEMSETKQPDILRRAQSTTRQKPSIWETEPKRASAPQIEYNTIDFVNNISSLLRCRTDKRDQQKCVHRNDKDKEVSTALPSWIDAHHSLLDQRSHNITDV